MWWDDDYCGDSEPFEDSVRRVVGSFVEKNKGVMKEIALGHGRNDPEWVGEVVSEFIVVAVKTLRKKDESKGQE